MADLISRAAAIEHMKSMAGCATCDNYNYVRCRACSWNDAMNIVEELPAVDAVPVVHARWTTERTWKHDGEWYCSACEYEPVVFMDSAFCPNCGAKMDGERRESE